MIYLIEMGKNDIIGQDGYENIENYKTVNSSDIRKNNILESADLPPDELLCISAIADIINSSHLEVDKVISDDFGKYRKVAKALKSYVDSGNKSKIKIIQDSLIRGIYFDKEFYETYFGIRGTTNHNILDVLRRISIYDKIINGESLIEFYERFKKIVDILKKYDNSLIPIPNELINMFYYYIYDKPIDMNIFNPFLLGEDEVCIHTLNLERKYIYRSHYYNDPDPYD